MTKTLVITAEFRFPILATPTQSGITEETLLEYPILPTTYLNEIQIDDPEDRDYAATVLSATVVEEDD